MNLIEKIKSKKANIGVIGLGYVGLPLTIEFCKAGFHVTGFDIDPEKIELLKQGKSYIKHIDGSLFTAHGQRFSPTTDFSRLSAMECIIICVPTPLNEHREPDMTYVFNTTKTIAQHMGKEKLIVLESTTYPGTTDQEMRGILEETGLKAGKDFYLAYSPEREDPNNKDFSTSTIPKVVGGYTNMCLSIAKALYDSVVKKTVAVSSTRVAEATKLLENIYRSVNIALVNELKMLFDRMNIDIFEVIDAAKTKPFGFQAFYPGPGLGGHCIPIDPFYLTWKAREYDFHTKFIELAGEINTYMPYYVIQKTIEALNNKSKSLRGAKILLLGVSYKKDIDDVRESPALRIMELFEKNGAHVDYHDPYINLIPKTRKYSINKSSVTLTAYSLSTYDCVVITTDHSEYDAGFIVNNSKIVVDTRNVINNSFNHNGNVIKA
ncbi:MAG: nucleotide sugar dehydrogenase [Candidatus Kuenenia sp.]|nr:nucleotide sugar dehydrogenase [Candidatus Kuenenia hertensis]